MNVGTKSMKSMSFLFAATCLLGSLFLFVGCSAESPETQQESKAPKPKQAGKPVDSRQMAGRIMKARAAAVVGDDEEVQKQAEAVGEDMRLAMKMPDPNRKIDPEAARIAATQVSEVKGAYWVDHENLLVRVAHFEQRSQETIDAVCLALEPLGDTLAVVVNVQSSQAKNAAEMETLSRNCQLPEGERALMQKNRRMDVVSPETRKAFEMQNKK